MSDLKQKYGRLFELHGNPPEAPAEPQGTDYAEMIQAVTAGPEREALTKLLRLLRRHKARAFVAFLNGGCKVGLEMNEEWELRRIRVRPGNYSKPGKRPYRC
jgi:hypothetical protein